MDFSNMSEFDDLSNVFKDSQFDFLNDSFIRVDPNMLFDDPELDFLNFYLGPV